MTESTFERLIEKFFEKNCLGLMNVKSKEYSTDSDKLHNFKKAGRRRNKSPEEALVGMQEKHGTSIDDMIQDLEKRYQKEGPNFKISREELAVWEEKIGDDINYSFLLWGLLNERVEND